MMLSIRDDIFHVKQFIVTDMVGKERSYRSTSVQNLRLELARERGLLYPFIILLKKSPNAARKSGDSNDFTAHAARKSGDSNNCMAVTPNKCGGSNNCMAVTPNNCTTDYSGMIIEDYHDIARIFGRKTPVLSSKSEQSLESQQQQLQQPQLDPYHLIVINNEEAVKRDMREKWNGREWVHFLGNHQRYGDATLIGSARELSEKYDPNFEHKIHEWMREVYNLYSEYREYPLEIMNRYVEEIRMILALGVGYRDASDISGNTLLHGATRFGHMDMIYSLLDGESTEENGGNKDKNDDNTNETNVNVRNAYGHTSLLTAARTGRADAAFALIKGGANPSYADIHGWAPLHSAARDGNADIVTMLLDAGACVNTPIEKKLDTPLHLAAIEGSVEVIHLLFRAGAVIDMNSSGETPYEVACNDGCRRALLYHCWRKQSKRRQIGNN